MTANLNMNLPKIESLPEPKPAPKEIQQMDKEKAFKKRGSKHEVFHGLALQTGGGLRKADLIQNKRGAVVSKKRSEQGAKQFKNIEKYIQEKKKHKQELEAEQDSEPEIKPSLLKPEAIQEEKEPMKPPIETTIKEEPPAKSESLSASNIPEMKPLEKKKRGRKIKDEGALIDVIKHQ